MAKKQQPTLGTVCDGFVKWLCKVPRQDFGTAAIVREVRRAVDLSYTKKLKPNQVKRVRSFLRVIATAYK